jgi:hypothetical protein
VYAAGCAQDDWRKIAIALIDWSKPVMAFHENAGPRQVDFDFAFLKTHLPS